MSDHFSEEDFAHALFVWALIFILGFCGVFSAGFFLGRRSAPECPPLPACDGARAGQFKSRGPLFYCDGMDWLKVTRT